MQLYAGTSGYSYKEWKGPFYPDKLPNKDMLRYYSTQLPAVEINSTFYRMPGKDLLAAWSEQVTPGFRFILKAPRKITHMKPLKEKHDELQYLFKTAAILGEKLGAVLFQLPPYLPKDTALLTDFFDDMPSGAMAAFEFRHTSWFDEEVFDLLREKGYTLCCSDGENEDLRKFIPTSGWGYLRLRRSTYTQAELAAWKKEIQSQHWRLAYSFFKHEDAGAGPKLAKQFLELAV